MATYYNVTVSKSATVNHNNNHSSSTALKITFDALKVPKGTTAYSWKIDTENAEHRHYLYCADAPYWGTYSSKEAFEPMHWDSSGDKPYVKVWTDRSFNIVAKFTITLRCKVSKVVKGNIILAQNRINVGKATTVGAIMKPTSTDYGTKGMLIEAEDFNDDWYD